MAKCRNINRGERNRPIQVEFRGTPRHEGWPGSVFIVAAEGDWTLHFHTDLPSAKRLRKELDKAIQDGSKAETGP